MAVVVQYTTYLATRMAHGTVFEFDQKKSIDFRERFDFYCLANNICDNNEENLRCKKTLFLTLLGQLTFTELSVGES